MRSCGHADDATTTSLKGMALGYTQLQRVEPAQHESGLNPVFHWAPHRIHAQVAGAFRI